MATLTGTDSDSLRIDALRARKEERRKRFLDAKSRTMGVDKAFLEQQAKEAKAKARAEKEADALHAEHQARVCDILAQQQAADFEERRLEAAAVQDALREQMASKTSSKEWDLNDPDALKKDLPARMGDDDARCGASSLQLFAGEDLGGPERLRMQQAQMRDWAAQQLAEKERAATLAKSEDAEYAQYVATVDDVRGQLASEDLQYRSAAAREVRDENLRLAKQKLERESAARDEAEAQASREIDANLTSKQLLEDRELGVSAAAAHRVRRDHYKGMSADQLQAIRDEQRRQVEEKQKAAAEAKDEEALWAAHQEQLRQHMLHTELDAQAERAATRKSNQNDILKQRVEHAELEAERKAANINKPDASFFQQFGTSDR